MELLLERLHEVQDPTLYQMVAEEWGGERLHLVFPSPVACLSAGYLLPRLPYPHIQLRSLDDQRIVLFTKGLNNSCVDHQQPRSGISITLSFLSLHSHDDLQGIAHLLSSSFSISHLVLDFSHGLSIHPRAVLRCIHSPSPSLSSLSSIPPPLPSPPFCLPLLSPSPSLLSSPPPPPPPLPASFVRNVS